MPIRKSLEGPSARPTIRECERFRSKHSLRSCDADHRSGLATSAAEDGAARRRARLRRARVLVAEIDPSLGEVVRRHFHRDAIPRKNSDAVLFHAPGGVGNNLVSILELNTATSIRQHFGHDALELQHFFFRHASSWLSSFFSRRCAKKMGRTKPAPISTQGAGVRQRAFRLTADDLPFLPRSISYVTF